ncbi:hypothetical protein SFRURICE_005632 [Spodoptera frugiperda]|nr:hypothetical protein SFRURICE_005632 [Spodoptera frugiperda]
MRIVANFCRSHVSARMNQPEQTDTTASLRIVFRCMNEVTGGPITLPIFPIPDSSTAFWVSTGSGNCLPSEDASACLLGYTIKNYVELSRLHWASPMLGKSIVCPDSSTLTPAKSLRKILCIDYQLY